MEKGRWPTSDLRLGAYLSLIGLKIVETKKAGGRVIFEFEDVPERQPEINRFYNREARVDPLAYTAAMSDLRDMVRVAQGSGVPTMARGNNGRD